MEYNDEQILGLQDYENIAKAYSSALQKRGFMIVQIDNDKYKEVLKEVFDQLFIIKSTLFMLGGFLNTSKFYSLNERQIKKISLLFDIEVNAPHFSPPRDKTKCFLTFLSHECKLINLLISLSDQTNYEVQIKDMISSRLNLLSQILEI